MPADLDRSRGIHQNLIIPFSPIAFTARVYLLKKKKTSAGLAKPIPVRR